jgi:hypothetical protein
MKRKRRTVQSSRQSEGEQDGGTHVGDISGGKGFAIGPGARSFFFEIGSLVDLGVLLPLIKRHWLFLTASVVLQAIATALWWRYADRFLISVWVLLGGMGLLEAGLFSGYGLRIRPRGRQAFALVTTVSLLALAGLKAAVRTRRGPIFIWLKLISSITNLTRLDRRIRRPLNLRLK